MFTTTQCSQADNEQASAQFQPHARRKWASKSRTGWTAERDSEDIVHQNNNQLQNLNDFLLLFKIGEL